MGRFSPQGQCLITEIEDLLTQSGALCRQGHYWQAGTGEEIEWEDFIYSII